MSQFHNPSTHSLGHHKNTALACSLLLGVVLLSGCTPGDDTATEPLLNRESAQSQQAPPEEEPQEQEPQEQEQAAKATPPEEPKALDHNGALESGLLGEQAIKCLYTFDDEELAGMRIMAAGGWVTPTADIHLKGESIYWVVPEANDRTAHILAADGNTYSWKSPGDGGAISAPTMKEDVQVLAARMKSHASNCAPYTGPNSIFEVPENLTFSEFPG